MFRISVKRYQIYLHVKLKVTINDYIYSSNTISFLYCSKLLCCRLLRFRLRKSIYLRMVSLYYSEKLNEHSSAILGFLRGRITHLLGKLKWKHWILHFFSDINCLLTPNFSNPMPTLYNMNGKWTVVTAFFECSWPLKAFLHYKPISPAHTQTTS